MGLRRIPFALRALLAPILMAAWIPLMFLTASYLETTYYRRKTYQCFHEGQPRDDIGNYEYTPAYLRKAAEQLRTRPNPEVWCGATPEGVFAPGDDRFQAIRRGAGWAAACVDVWTRFVPLGVPVAWQVRHFPFSQTYESLREVDYAWRDYNKEVDKLLFQTCQANQQNRGTHMARLTRYSQDGHMEDIRKELPVDTWFIELGPEVLQDYIAQLERFADRFEAAMDRYEPEHNYLIYLSIPIVLAFCAFSAFMTIVGGTVLEDLKQKLLELDKE